MPAVIHRFLLSLFTVLLSSAAAMPAVIDVDMRRLGVRPGKSDVSAAVAKALRKLPAQAPADTLRLVFAPGRYDFYPEKAASAELYVSNHDQTNPKRVGVLLEKLENLIVDASGAEFVFHGRMLPVALLNSRNVTLRGFSVDFAEPHISQVRIVGSDEGGILFRPEPWVKWRLDGSRFVAFGHGWSNTPPTGIAFDPATRGLLYRTADLAVSLDSVISQPDGTVLAPRWIDPSLVPGTVVALRTYDRPAPAVFLHRDTATRLEDIRVRYAEGMGLLAQLCSDISLDGFSVCLRGDDDPRFFTTQADATHFSGCSGLIDSRNGLYENMMDDAINVHGTYLKVIEKRSPRTFVARYMHPQTYGFAWAEPGDSVRFVRSAAMEYLGGVNVVEDIRPLDSPGVHGAKEFLITLRDDIVLPESSAVGIENMSLNPEVVFAGNVVRNNRARGALFSTPRPVLVENNLFDHTSGTAILLCGDCNGWFESGPCRDVLIRGNRFVNALTSRFQFTEAVISIYPEIPDIAGSRVCFHGGEGSEGVVITDNYFSTFDAPLLYAKSISGLRFSGNTVEHNRDFEPYHPNRYTFRFLRAENVVVDGNSFPDGFSPSFKID